MVAFCETREWALGDVTQKAWAAILAKRGYIVIPLYGMDEVAARTKAPVLFFQDQLLIAPDLLVMQANGFAISWHEVKAKTAPTWHRNNGRWEHGIDFALFLAYKELQRLSSHAVYFVVGETTSPDDPDCQSALIGPPAWLWISLDAAEAAGEIRGQWPKRNGNPNDLGRDRRGGFLWPRSTMKEFTP